jgi:alkylhydroperoxidase family enzyme
MNSRYAAAQFALAASSIPNAVDEVIATELHRHWSDDEIVEILGVVALFGFLTDGTTPSADTPRVPPLPKWSAHERARFRRPKPRR